ncbi:hypothetical protein RJ640_003994 [Escallonia rubra]|uniref:Uncharacterized protein n=1 Tax=Escallonia rubra TaxID=112253 RepID=A0AA88S038_9ASTE|nr:hypothetical protein RJ640_003994 [Escallonia rubra]
MDLDNIECVSSSDGMEEDEIHLHHHPQFSSSKPHNSNLVHSAIHPTTSVHELLECPVCTNSMYPPIHQRLLNTHARDATTIKLTLGEDATYREAFQISESVTGSSQV